MSRPIFESTNHPLRRNRQRIRKIPLKSLISEGFWSEWGDSNARSLEPKSSAIPTSLHPVIHFSAMIPRRAEKIKFFLSVVIYVVKADFIPLSATGESPANAGVTRLCGVSPYPIPNTTTALPKQARYQLRSPPEIFIFICAAIRCALLCSPGLRFPKKILALFACSIFSTAGCAV